MRGMYDCGVWGVGGGVGVYDCGVWGCGALLSSQKVGKIKRSVAQISNYTNIFLFIQLFCHLNESKKHSFLYSPYILYSSFYLSQISDNFSSRQRDSR